MKIVFTNNTNIDGDKYIYKINFTIVFVATNFL